MMATTLTWVYADHLQTAPDRKYKIRGRSGFAFSDVRRIIAEAALSDDFRSVCPLPEQRPQNSFVKTMLRMVAWRIDDLNYENLQETLVIVSTHLKYEYLFFLRYGS